MSKKLWRVDDSELGYVKRAIDSGLTGEFTKNFEIKFAEKFNSEYAIAVNSGTSALHVAMLALGIKAGDEVIVPPLTFIATAYAVLYVGAVPVFADIDPDTFNIDPKKIEEKITHRTKAIITVSIYGLPPEMEAIVNIAEKYKLKIVEDNAQCVLGKYKGKIAGTIGDISIFSMQRSKHLTSGDGGVIVTSNQELAEKCRKYADLGYRTLTAKPITNEDIKDTIQQPDYKRHELIGYNFRMPEVCAAMGISQLEKVDTLVQRRMKIASMYAKAIKECSWLTQQLVNDNIQHSYWCYTLKLDVSSKNISWQDFRECFMANGGESFYGAWSLSYLEPSLLGMKFSDIGMEYKKGLCPIAESIQPNLIQLKTNFEDISYGQEQSKILSNTIKELDSA